MAPKKASVNMKVYHKKKDNPQKKADDGIAPSGHDQNSAPTEQSLTWDGRVNGELHSQREGATPGGIQSGDLILQHIREQDGHINRLSNTVDELRKTMGEMNEALARLRGGSQENRVSVTDALSGDKFDLVASVLRDVRSKDDQLERLKLKNDVLTLQIRYLEEKYSDNGAGSRSEIPDDYYEQSIDRSNPRTVMVPVKQGDGSGSGVGEQRQFPEVQVSIPTPRGRPTKRRPTSDVEIGAAGVGTDPEQLPPKPPAKKPKHSSSKAPALNSSGSTQKPPLKRGRPPLTAKTQAAKATTVLQNTTDPVERNENQSHPTLPLRHVSLISNLSAASTTKEPDIPKSPSPPGTQQRRRSARSVTRQSRRPSVSPPPEPEQPTAPSSDMSVGEDLSANDLLKEFQDEQERTRKEKIAARDRLVEMAMQREEAMDMAEGMGHDH